MKLRDPRTEIPDSTYWADMLKLMHPMMFLPILMLVTIGTWLAPEVDLWLYGLELITVVAIVLSAYHLDEAIEKVTAPTVPKHHNWWLFATFWMISGALCIYFWNMNVILVIPSAIAIWGAVGYNMDLPLMKNRFVYALVWGGTPIFGSYMLQTGNLPDEKAIIMTCFGMAIATKLFWNWSLRTCGRYPLCPKNCQLVTSGVPPGYWEEGENKYCHSPDTMRCMDRLQVPKEVNNTMKVLQKLDIMILFYLMLAVIIW